MPCSSYYLCLVEDLQSPIVVVFGLLESMQLLFLLCRRLMWHIRILLHAVDGFFQLCLHMVHSVVHKRLQQGLDVVVLKEIDHPLCRNRSTILVHFRSKRQDVGAKCDEIGSVLRNRISGVLRVTSCEGHAGR